MCGFLSISESSGLHLAFPNVRIALRIYLTMLTTNAEGERSALKRLKSPLRSSLAQDKLKGLALLTMESELTRSLDFEDVLNEFVNSKSRKRKFLHKGTYSAGPVYSLGQGFLTGGKFPPWGKYWEFRGEMRAFENCCLFKTSDTKWFP